jgi:hypothetical protein
MRAFVAMHPATSLWGYLWRLKVACLNWSSNLPITLTLCDFDFAVFWFFSK